MFFHEYWWIFPLAMIIVCFLFMRGGGMCGHGSHDGGKYDSESARDILDKRYATGEIDSAEYEEIKKHLSINNE